MAVAPPSAGTELDGVGAGAVLDGAALLGRSLAFCAGTDGFCGLELTAIGAGAGAGHLSAGGDDARRRGGDGLGGRALALEAVALDVVDFGDAGRDDRHGSEAGRGLRGDGADARRQRAARGRTARGDAARGRRAARRRPGARGALGQEELLEQQQRPDREDGGKCLVGLAQLLLEGAAALAAAHVAADRRADAGQALGPLAQLAADLIAGQPARLGRLGERDPRADEQRLDREQYVVSRPPDACQPSRDCGCSSTRC